MLLRSDQIAATRSLLHGIVKCTMGGKMGIQTASGAIDASRWVGLLRTSVRQIHEQHPHRGDWLNDVVFGLYDGLVTTLVFVLAVSAVAHRQLVFVALGELFAGGVSMGLGAYLSARTERAILAHRIATERYEIANEPGEEQAELRQIYYEKGFRGSLLDRVVGYLTADKNRWLQALVRDELGIVREDWDRSPWRQGLLVGGSFMVGAFVPIVPFLLGLPLPPVWAYGLTAVTALVLGAVKARFTLSNPLVNGLEFLGIVTAGAGLGVAIGFGLSALMGAG